MLGILHFNANKLISKENTTRTNNFIFRFKICRSTYISVHDAENVINSLPYGTGDIF